MGGENTFNMIFFFDDGQFKDEGLTVTGAHVDCGTLVYCRRGDGTAIIGGLSESSPSLPRGAPWASFSPDGSGLPNLEHMTSHDGYSVWSTSVQPRVGTDRLRARRRLSTSSSARPAGDRHVPVRARALPVTTPAISTLRGRRRCRADGHVSRRLPAPPARAPSNPIALDATGKLTLTFWRPQRLAVPGAETGDFVDMGHLHYGVSGSTPNGSREVACAGYYSDLSRSLSQTAANGDFSQSLFPLTRQRRGLCAERRRHAHFTLDVAGCFARRAPHAGQHARVDRSRPPASRAPAAWIAARRWSTCASPRGQAPSGTTTASAISATRSMCSTGVIGCSA